MTIFGIFGGFGASEERVHLPLLGPLRASLALLVLLLRLLLLLPLLLRTAMHLSFESAGRREGRAEGEVAGRPLGHRRASCHRQEAWNSRSGGVGALSGGDTHDGLEAGGRFQHTGQALVEGPASSGLFLLAALLAATTSLSVLDV